MDRKREAKTRIKYILGRRENGEVIRETSCRFHTYLEYEKRGQDFREAYNLDSVGASTVLVKEIPAQKYNIFCVNNKILKKFRENYPEKNVVKKYAGEYSCLKAQFFLQRNIGYHLVQNYLPTILIVVISWVSFFLGVDAIPARITLGVTTLLTISSKGSGIQASIPPVSYVKAVDVWMGACTTMVFSALLEFTFVNYMSRRKRKLKSKNCPVNGGNNQETWLKLAPVSI
ncbi:Glutamate-gated chloride channel [Nymphon striatum]|nr:Glutamate-gated chloride channel [Nymphon striatum]